MSEAQGDAHGAGHEEHKKTNSISDLVNMMEPIAMPTLSAATGAGAAYLAFGSTIAYAPIAVGGLLGLGLYLGYKKLFGSDKKEDHGHEDHHEPALAGVPS